MKFGNGFCNGFSGFNGLKFPVASKLLVTEIRRRQCRLLRHSGATGIVDIRRKTNYGNSLFPIPYSLFPIPYSLFPIPSNIIKDLTC